MKIEKDSGKIILLKVLRLLCLPLGLLMYFFARHAWGDVVALTLGFLSGIGYFLIMSEAILLQIGSELKGTMEKIIRVVCESPACVQYETKWGSLIFVVFIQEENETVNKVIYKKIIENLGKSLYYSKVDMISMANVPNLKEETLAKVKDIMMENADNVSRDNRRR